MSPMRRQRTHERRTNGMVVVRTDATPVIDDFEGLEPVVLETDLWCAY